MSRFGIITEDDFDKLPEQSQMKYVWCPICKNFYLIEDKNKHLCGGVE